MEHNLDCTDEEAAISAIEVQNAIIYDSFHSACSSGDINTLRMILNGCTDQEKHEFLNHTTNTGTPIFDAIFADRKDVVTFLVESGYELETECDVNIFYPILLRDKLTALSVACAVGNEEITQIFLEHGAQVNHSSQHSSPLIYASEYNNVELVSILLKYGADINIVPQSLHTETAVLPLYQACIGGHSETAELLFMSSDLTLSLNKKVCLLGLLGAQCINKQDDYANGVKFWRRALQELNENSPEGADLSVALEQMYIGQDSVVDRGLVLPVTGANQITSEAIVLKHRHQIFNDMKLCTSLEELDSIAYDENLLRLQGLLVLENVLGPSHNETTQQVSKAARNALENNDLSLTCKLFLYIIEGNERRNNSATSTEYTAQLAELLLNGFSSNRDILKNIEDIMDILEAAIEFTQETICKVFTSYAECCSGIHHGEEASSSFDFDSKKKQHDQIKMLTELAETFIGYLCIFLDQKYTGQQWKSICVSIVKILQLSSINEKSAYNVESELLKLAVFGGHSASSTLYFFQETLLPSIKVLQCLLHCGADVDRQDIVGNTTLHYSLNPDPKVSLVEVLVNHGAHIDTFNHAGVTPLSLILKNKSMEHLLAFQYMTLKCLAATVVMRFRIPYVTQVPVALEKFIVCHGVPLNKDHKALKRSASEGDNNP